MPLTDSIEIAPGVSGYVTDVLVEPGKARIDAGDALFRINPVAFESRVSELEAQLELARIRQGQAEQLVKKQAGRVGDTLHAPPAVSETRDLLDAFAHMREQVQQRERELDHLAHHDALTGLPNRALFRRRLAEAIADAQQHGMLVGLLFMDLDRFKDVNDTFGHPVGDRSLEITARRIVDTMDPGTLIGRLAGDEFAILIENLPLADSIQPALAATARMLLDRVAREFYVEKRELFVTASIGVAICPNDADNVVDLIRNADAAMYHAKQAGGNTYGFYTPQMNADAVDRLMLKSELRRALERLGRTGTLFGPRQEDQVVAQVAEEVARAAHRLSGQRHDRFSGTGCLL